ncbi:MAG: tRNA (cytidine(34)-2'-O)-methyltransferase [Planctomycetes bacterium]|nr:tRNA (cytidine(34)-2'-O)-methyltransferase [Planctomycetota bacterium]
MDAVLVHPEIPHNTGCAARLCAALGVRLHLVEPLGFQLEDRHLKRAGLDYWPEVELWVHPDAQAARAHLEASSPRPLPERLRPFTARGGQSCFEATFAPDDILVFGCESKGLPEEWLGPAERRVYLPIRPGVRSLNLANAVAVGLYTALDRAGVPLPDNDGRYEPPAEARGLRPGEVAQRSVGTGPDPGPAPADA